MILSMGELSAYLREVSKPSMATVERAREVINAAKTDPAPPAEFTRDHQVEVRTVHGFPCYTVPPGPSERTGKAVIYVHGGSYVKQIVKEHWEFIGRLADGGTRVEVPIYGLAPGHTYREAFGFLAAVYERLLRSYEPAEVVIAGDSAGGGLALALAQALETFGLPAPGRLILLSPWLDVTMSNPAIAEVEPLDPWLTSVGLIESARAWADGDDPADPRLSPLNGDLSRLPPIDLFTGTHDVLHPDALLLRDRAPIGAEVNLHIVPGGVHVYVLTPVSEAGHALERILEILKVPGREGCSP
jgi:monoterpene epsilon-lactone hydrolase